MNPDSKNTTMTNPNDAPGGPPLNPADRSQVRAWARQHRVEPGTCTKHNNIDVLVVGFPYFDGEKLLVLVKGITTGTYYDIPAEEL